MIRPAKQEDVQDLVGLAKSMHEESLFSSLSFNAGKASEMFSNLIDDQMGAVFVYEKDGAIIGAIAGAIDCFWFSDDCHAFDFGLFVLPCHRGGSAALRLIKAFEAWAEIKGAAWIDLGISTGVHAEKTARMYEKMDYKIHGYLARKGV